MLEIGQTKKIFDQSEAQSLLPLVQAVTEKHQQQLQPIQERLNRMLSNDPRRKHLEVDFADVVSRWRIKVQQLGVLVTDLWVVGFDVGEGVLSWKYPELSLGFFIAHASPEKRLKLSDYIDEYDPDWAC